MTLQLIRHGKTDGNLQHRYLGVTDEPLCAQGKQELYEYKKAGMYWDDTPIVLSSPLSRCMETANILYPSTPIRTVTGFREMNFGEFENKNYQELADNPAYQQWVDSGGEMAFPGGESKRQFCDRCLAAFQTELQFLQEQEIDKAVLVVHGGTIMALVSTLTNTDYYQWQVKNGQGVVLRQKAVLQLKESNWTARLLQSQEENNA